MEIKEWEKQVEDICYKNNWKLLIELDGIWRIIVMDKDTGITLATTGATGVTGIPKILEMPFDKCPWK